jgi:alkylhydroperoxidase family enzyme
MAAIANPESDALSSRERAAVRYAQAVTIDAGGISPATYADFIQHFTPQERVEVTIVATAMGMINKCNDALRIPLESEFEALVS